MARQRRPLSSADCEMRYLLIGRTGFGKSTTGNKIIGVCDPEEVKRLYSIDEPRSRLNNALKVSQPREELSFQVRETGTILSTTKQCQLLINYNLSISVLDVKGFGDSKDAASTNVYLSNLAIVREIIRVQLEQNPLRFNRIVYFVPVRGIPETPDGPLQEELNALFYFFGFDVLKYMVLVVTSQCSDEDDYDEELDDGDMDNFKLTKKRREKIEKIYGEAFACLVGEANKNRKPGTPPIRHPQCPPIVYISKKQSGEEVRRKLKDVPVESNAGLKLQIQDDVCAKCTGTIRYSKTQNELLRTGFYLNGKLIEYGVSKCHPMFIPKHMGVTKFVGGMFQLATLGLASFVGVPGFFNSEEICPSCKKSPGSPGCLKVSVVFATNNSTVVVDHDNTIEEYKLEEV